MSAVEPRDRRRERHRESADEVVGVALQVMAESGAAGMTLGEVARRMGIKPPSLYVYFPSKNALCDEIFARGWQSAAALLSGFDDELDTRPAVEPFLVDVVTAFVDWASANPAYAQLMFWRPLPSWEPSPQAYAPAVALLDRTTAALATLRQQGSLRRDADLEEATAVWTVLVSGLISQQLANEPRAAAGSGRFRALVPPLVQAFLARYGTRRSSR